MIWFNEQLHLMSVMVHELGLVLWALIFLMGMVAVILYDYYGKVQEDPNYQIKENDKRCKKLLSRM